MFKLLDQRYAVDSRAIVDARKAVGMTQSEFARVCGWSASYQWRLKNDRVDSVSEGTKNIVENAFKNL